MKIGIDLDGVVIDSETTFRTYEEIFDIDVLKGNNLINLFMPFFLSTPISIIKYSWYGFKSLLIVNNIPFKVLNDFGAIRTSYFVLINS